MEKGRREREEGERGREVEGRMKGEGQRGREGEREGERREGRKELSKADMRSF